MTYTAVIFDMDGTLLDTLDDLAASANRVLAARGFPTHPHDAYRWFIGDGSALLMTRALPPAQRTPQSIQSCLEALLDDYNQNWHRATRPYDGIVALLDALKRRSMAMSVVTNKPHRFTGQMIEHYFKGVPFRRVLGQQEGIAKKPDPGQATAAAQAMGAAPAACLFLGDSAVDMETARRAGMAAVGAGWGFRPVQELREAGALQVIAHPLDLLPLLEG
jgi:phosphoglycolate phosphatase